jgi:hypothetical protein
MRVREILKENQSEEYKKLTETNKVKKKKYTDKEIERLMYHSSYKRSRRGAIKQVR